MEEIIKVIVENGVIAVIIGYYIFKDLKFTTQMTTILTEIKSVLSILKDMSLTK